MLRNLNKKSLDEILGFDFDLKELKVNTYYVKRNQFCKGL